MWNRWIPTRSATPSTALVPQRKVGFPIPNPAFCSVSKGQRRLGEKEYRAPSVTPGVALRVRTQALLVEDRGCRIPTSQEPALDAGFPAPEPLRPHGWSNAPIHRSRRRSNHRGPAMPLKLVKRHGLPILAYGWRCPSRLSASHPLTRTTFASRTRSRSRCDSTDGAARGTRPSSWLTSSQSAL